MESFEMISFPQSLRNMNIFFNYIKEWNASEPIKAMSVNLNHNLFRSFPVKILDSIEIRALTLSHCQIKGELNIVLPKNISNLDLSYNEIENLGDQFISSMTNISCLNLSNNLISSISDSFPEKIPMTQLLLNNNRIGSLPASMNNLKYLEILNISHNSLVTLPSFSFSNLRIFNTSFNCIVELPDTLSSSQYLTEINVAFNQLKTLPRSMSQCRKVIEVNISGNQFIVFPRCLFSFSQLKILFASGNRLSSIPSSFGSFFFLQTLDLSNNHFTELPLFLHQFTSLKYLIFSHNLISCIPNDFQLPLSLLLFDLSYNKLTSFNLSIPSIFSLSLDCNAITEFNPSFVPSSKFISLNSNFLTTPVPCLLELIMQLPSLMSFEIINNPIGFTSELPPLPFHFFNDSSISAIQRFGVGYSGTMGTRPTMEDAVTFHQYDENHSLYALFDGHHGEKSATLSALCLQKELSKVVSVEHHSVPTLFSDSFEVVNNRLRSLNVTDGCTAVALLVKENTCYSVGVGDSRIVRVTKCSVERLTQDSKPTNRLEYERLRGAGLTVNAEGRINRKLAVARSLGDFWCGEGLFVKPDVSSFTLTDEDDSIIIACDGVWDVIDDEFAAKVVRESHSAQDAATTLRNFAFALSSNDNISVIVIKINPIEGQQGLQYHNTIEILPQPIEELDVDADLGVTIASPRSNVRKRR